MITLYIKDNCGYSEKALSALEDSGVQHEVKNINNPMFLDELMELGRKHQVPFMVDDPHSFVNSRTPCLLNGDVFMYESSDIVKYIEEKFVGGGSSSKVTNGYRLHVVDDNNICDGCE